MTRTNAIVALLMICGCVEAAPGLEPWRGFDVKIDVMTDPIRVNGLPLVVHRASGKGVDRLANAISKQWGQEVGGQGIRSVAQGGWMILSRIHNGTLEVLQWRGIGAEAEMLWSSSRLRARIQEPPSADMRLPLGCRYGHTVHGNVDGGSYIQRTAHCNRSPRATIAALDVIARDQGFSVLSRSESMFMARRRATEIRVLVSERDPSSVTEGSTLVYLQVERKGRLP